MNYQIVEHVKTAFEPHDLHRLLWKNGKAKFIGSEFAKSGHPFNGVAYWKWQAIKFEGKLYILEFHPHKNDEDYDVITKEIQY